jgi:hypothetical protein
MAGSVPKTVGELELSKLLSSLTAVLDPELYVFITLPQGTPPPVDLAIQMLFREREGLTVIATKNSSLEHGFAYTFPCRMITMDVHSSLEAVGFMAVITDELKQLKIGVNPVSGYFHDHIFIPEGREMEVMAALKEIRQRAKSGKLMQSYSFPWRLNVDSESGPLLPPI